MNKAYKFRLYPNKEQQIMLNKTFGCVRFVYNIMLSDKIISYEAEGKAMSCTPAEYKGMYPFLKEVDSLALANAQINLQTAFKNFFERKEAGYPKYKSKKTNHFSYTTNCVNNNIVLSATKIKLPKLTPIRIKKHRDVPADYKLKSVTISKTPSGKYFASILFEYENQVNEKEVKTFVGLDFAMHGLFVASDGYSCDFPRYYRRSEQQLKKAQRKLSLMQKGSKNRNKQRIKVAKLHEKVANQRKDLLHKESKKLADSFDAVCIEDLDMKAMSRSLHFGKSVHDNGWGMFCNFLEYKLNDTASSLSKSIETSHPARLVLYAVSKIRSRKIYLSENGLAKTVECTMTVISMQRSISEMKEYELYPKMIKNRGAHGVSSLML